MSSRLFYFFYRFVVWPILKIAFNILAVFVPKIREGLKMRLPVTKVNGQTNGKKTQRWLNYEKGQAPVWIHCASGEFEYAKPVITRLKEKFPNVKIIVTYFSPSIAKAVRGFPGIDFSSPVPWDEKRSIDEFLNFHRPKLLLIARTDTWPEMLERTKTSRIPILLFSATLPKSAGRARGFGAWAARSMFENLTEIYCVSPDDAEVFSQLGFAAKTKVMGDTRYDQVQERLRSPKKLKDEIFITRHRPILIAGSTWTEDEVVVVEVASRLKNKVDFVIVPHEPTPKHIAELTALIESRGLRAVLYSKASAWPEEAVMIVDQIGILAELYQKGRFAFVGGSYRKTVHSVMEPLAAGCLTFVGPLHQNNREALEFAQVAIKGTRDATCVQPAKNANEFCDLLNAALTLPQEVKFFIQSEIAERSGKSDLVVQWCEDHATL